MRNNNLSLLSGRVKKVASTSADANRYSYLDLKNAEPDAGVPSAHSSSRGLFGSDINGTRQWFYADAGLSVDTSTGQITVNEDTVAIDTSAFTNSTSDNLADVLSDFDQSLQSLGNNSLTTVSTDDTIIGAGTSGSPLSVGQKLFHDSKPEFAGLAITPDSIDISGLSLANPLVITTTGSHGLTDGELVTIENISGTTELNGNNYYVDALSASTIALYSDQGLSTSINGTTGFSAYTSSGRVLSGGYRLPESDGTDGTYLKTNGFGLLEFDRPSAYQGSAPANPDTGDLWYDTANALDLLIYTGSAWTSTTTGGAQAAFVLRQFVGDGSTTVFQTNSPGVQKVLVFLNGILLRLTDDFTLNSSTGAITFLSTPGSNDTIEVLLAGDADLVGLELLGIENHDLITVDSSGNVTLQGELDMASNKIVNVTDPTSAQDAATKAYVDSVVTAADLDIAGDSGTGAVDLDSQTFTISGTANEIETAASGQTVTLGLPSTITVDVTGNLTGNVTGTVSSIANHSTTDLTEGTNLYYTNARADARIAAADTDDLSEGTTNLYYTNARARASISATGSLSYNSTTGVISFTQGNTDTVAEGTTNLYYTNARADARIALQVGANLDLSSKSTDDLSEGSTNLYYTNARADARISAASITDLSDADQTVRTTDNVTFGNITTTGYIAGPATLTIDPAGVGDNTGKVVIAGDLQIDGTTTTINSTVVSVDDLNLTLASGAANASAANGAGITIDGASATFTYVSASDRWTMNKDLATDLVGNVTGNVSGSAGTVTSLSNRSVGDLSDVDITTTTPTNNQALVWDNANSKFIPGDSFSQSDFDTAFTSKDTDDLSEGTTNLYYTNARADARIAAADTDDLTEGTTNLYFTDERVDDRVANLIVGGVNVTTTYNDAAGTLEVKVPYENIDDRVASILTGSNGISVTYDDPNATITIATTDTDGITEGSTNLYYTNARADARIAAADTDDLSEGTTNLYYTNARFDTRFTSKSTTNLSEGTNLYYTDARADARIALQVGANLDLSSKSTTDLSEGTNLYYTDARFNTAFTSKDTDDLSEGTTNLYYTNARVDARIAAASIDDLTDVDITTAAPTNNQVLVWDNANSKFIPGDAAADFTDLTGQIAASQIPNSIITSAMLDPANVFSQEFTANGSTSAFTLSTDPGSKNAIQVFIDGVPQRASNYTVVGTTLTLGGTPVNGQLIEVRGYGVALPVGTVADNSITGPKLQDGTITADKIAASAYASETFTGDNSTTAFTLNTAPGAAQSLLVMIENVIQEPIENYTTSGTTLTFTGTPALNARIYVRYLGLPLANALVDNSVTNATLNLTYTSNQYTGDNTTTAYTIASGHTINSVLVVLDGLILPPSDYSVSGTTLTFASPPLTSQSIDIRYMPV